MAWIEVIPPERASGSLSKLYKRVSGPNGDVDNILQIHSLRPPSLEGHLRLYKNVLHHHQNQLAKWLLELLGCYVSICNQCDYCVAHHCAGLRRLIEDDEEADRIIDALEKGTWHEHLETKAAALLDYAHKLTTAPGTMTRQDVASLHEAGLEDGEILEANQVIGYFAYVNRTALGLGVDTQGEVLGLSPSSSDPDQWHHR